MYFFLLYASPGWRDASYYVTWQHTYHSLEDFKTDIIFPILATNSNVIVWTMLLAWFILQGSYRAEFLKLFTCTKLRVAYVTAVECCNLYKFIPSIYPSILMFLKSQHKKKTVGLWGLLNSCNEYRQNYAFLVSIIFMEHRDIIDNRFQLNQNGVYGRVYNNSILLATSVVVSLRICELHSVNKCVIKNQT